MNESSTIIKTVTADDVLAGRGGSTNKHPGNILYRALVKENRPTYQQMENHFHKQLLAESIIAAVHKRGGRFLRRHESIPGAWVELSMDESIIKTAQALREIPSGTSARALNVERILEMKRRRRETEDVSNSREPYECEYSFSTSGNACQADPMSQNEDDSRSCEPMICHFRGFCERRPESCHVVLNHDELEYFISDDDKYKILISLLE
jgi:hypothetical protein